MSETLVVLADKDIDDEDLKAAANVAYVELKERDVDIEGVAPVLGEGDDA